MKKISEKVFLEKVHLSKSINLKKNKNNTAPKNIEKYIKKYINASQASSTKRAYASDLRHFLAHGGSVPCSPKHLAKYLAESANDGLAVATIERRVVAIHQAHVDRHHQSPARAEIVRQVLQGIRRILGTKQRQAKPLLKNDLLSVLDAIRVNYMPVRASRDQALLLIGFASAMRRSELVGICVEHLSFNSEGLVIELPVSKTDQEMRGRSVFIPRASGNHCPINALTGWLKTASISYGHVFRSVNRHDGVAKRGLTAQSVSLIVKAAVAQVGADTKNISGHSLRAGYCTSAAGQGLQSWQLRAQTGHKSDVMLGNYIRRNNQQMTPSVL